MGMFDGIPEPLSPKEALDRYFEARAEYDAASRKICEAKEEIWRTFVSPLKKPKGPFLYQTDRGSFHVEVSGGDLSSMKVTKTRMNRLEEDDG